MTLGEPPALKMALLPLHGLRGLGDVQLWPPSAIKSLCCSSEDDEPEKVKPNKGEDVPKGEPPPPGGSSTQTPPSHVGIVTERVCYAQGSTRPPRARRRARRRSRTRKRGRMKRTRRARRPRCSKRRRSGEVGVAWR